MSGGEIGIRDILQQMRDDTVRQLDRIERKLDLKADAARVDQIEERLRRVETTAAGRLDLEDLEARVLSQDSIRQMIGAALQDSDTRGWTERERRMAVGAFLVLVLNFLIGLLALGPDIWH